MNGYNLFLDDDRNPSQVGNYMNPVALRSLYRLEQWVIVRNYDDFVECIERNGMPAMISFDHDLSDNHSAGDYSQEKTGYDCAKWLINYAQDNNIKLPYMLCHSMNPVGRDNILCLIRSYSIYVKQKY